MTYPILLSFVVRRHLHLTSPAQASTLKINFEAPAHFFYTIPKTNLKKYNVHQPYGIKSIR